MTPPKENCSICQFEKGHALTCPLYKKVPFESPAKKDKNLSFEDICDDCQKLDCECYE